jgi:hypothetical protein
VEADPIQDDLPTLEKVCRAGLSAALAREQEEGEG